MKTLILSDDAIILFENFDSNIGKIEFWSTLYALADVQINKMTKIASMNFYNDETNQEKKLKLKIDNILFFREALVKRMNSLKVKVESKKIIKGQNLEKRLTDKEINTMSINDAVKNIDLLVEKIKNKDVNFYVVNTFMRLVGRVRLLFLNLFKLFSQAIEHFSNLSDEKNIFYLNLMKEMLSLDYVQEVSQDIN